MDIQQLIKDALDKLEKDDTLVERFLNDPVKTLESILGVDLPEDKINPVIEGIKAKLHLNDVAKGAKQLQNALGGLGNLFGKK